MKQIPLANNKGFVLVDDEDFVWLNRWKWNLCKPYTVSYAQSTIKKDGKFVNVRMHRLQGW